MTLGTRPPRATNRYVALGAAIVIAAACGRATHTTHATHTSSDSSRVAADDCGADTTRAHPEPRALVDEYLRRGAGGDFMQRDAWHDGAVACPSHTPGWDEATIVAGWSLAELARRTDTARYAVTFTRLGRMTQDSAGPYVVAERGTEVDTLVAVRTSYGWRVGGDEIGPHVHADAIRRRVPNLRGGALLDSLSAAAR